MAEYIKREAAVKSVLRMRRPENSVAQNRMLSIIQMDVLKLPAADVAPVVHAMWIEDRSGIIICSECKRGYNLTAKYTHYCPNCGAQMHEDDFCSYGECREGKDEK